jgi:hypothetical protein
MISLNLPQGRKDAMEILLVNILDHFHSHKVKGILRNGKT